MKQYFISYILISIFTQGIISQNTATSIVPPPDTTNINNNNTSNATTVETSTDSGLHLNTSTTIQTSPTTNESTGAETPSPTSATTISSPASTTTVAPPTSPINSEEPTLAPTKISNHQFHAPSFIGGIVLALGLMAISYVGFKYYKSRTGRNYHTLQENLHM